MNKKIKRILALVVILAALAAAIWYWTRPQPIPVALATVDRGRVESTVANTRAGTVKACRRANLAPATGGQIAELPVHEGDHVKAGQVLLELWNDDLRAQVLLDRRQAVAAEAKAEEACIAAGVARKEAARLSKLLKKGLASEEATDRARGDADAKDAACNAARATTAVQEARVDVAKATLERTILRAPFDGVVGKINGEVGEFVTPSPVGLPTLPPVDLIDDSCLYVTAPMDEVDAPSIRPGMPVRISLDAFPKRKFPGKVDRVAPFVLDREKQARTVDIDVDFDTTDDTRGLLPGYSADVEVILAVKDDVIRVPTNAIREGDQVLVYRPDEGTLEERHIKTGVANWVYTQVLDGLKPGDRVVTSVDREGVGPGTPVVPERSTGN